MLANLASSVPPPQKKVFGSALPTGAPTAVKQRPAPHLAELFSPVKVGYQVLCAL